MFQIYRWAGRYWRLTLPAASLAKGGWHSHMIGAHRLLASCEPRLDAFAVSECAGREITHAVVALLVVTVPERQASWIVRDIRSSARLDRALWIRCVKIVSAEFDGTAMNPSSQIEYLQECSRGLILTRGQRVWKCGRELWNSRHAF